MQDANSSNVHAHHWEWDAFIHGPELRKVLLDQCIDLVCGPEVILCAHLPCYLPPATLRILKEKGHRLSVAEHTVNLMHDGDWCVWLSSGLRAMRRPPIELLHNVEYTSSLHVLNAFGKTIQHVHSRLVRVLMDRTVSTAFLSINSHRCPVESVAARH